MPGRGETRLVRILLVCPHAQMRTKFQEAITPLGTLAKICHTLPEYPNAATLARAMRLYAPEVVVLSFEHLEHASAVMGLVDTEVHGIPVIGINPTSESSVLLHAMRAGTRDFMSLPFQRETLAEGLRALRSVLREVPLAYTHTEHLYSFLPSKQGVGATTLAMNISAAVARGRDLRVLLADLDLSSGIVRFLLKLPAGSIMDAIHRSAEMDLELWRQTVVQRDGVDVLHSGGLDPQAQLDPMQVQRLVDFARKDYNYMCFDMSGNLEQYSLQVMGECKEIFLVCTPDMTSLQLGREKLSCLTAAGLQDRVSVLLNRQGQSLAVPTAKVEGIVGAPLKGAFGNHYKQVEKAVMAANWVEPGSPLGKQFADFARQLVEEPQVVSKAPPRANTVVKAAAPSLAQQSN